ncbi:MULTISPECIES: helix-turn-helix domain-containing protein [Pseudomonas]|uniref:helix-turn-helix domain-containing protein n=1 Tax=Pseudomonas TaxID=286 RepID=UPI00209374A7|nr:MULTISPECIES: helix-turn-helix domain-containing protein [Pseudomonas]USS54873.1 helix-turn-helix domain-containing protein [Pseudomonas kermanshahensis]UVL65062.1 helix-turn-helix domain-containing protein [Pseudomonas sp. B21-031]
MSIQSMTWALEQRLVTDPTCRHVLLCLANYADKSGRGAFPSASSLSEDTGLSERTIRYKLDALEAAGVIKRGNQAIAAAYIDRYDRRPVVYDMVENRGAPAAPRNEEDPERGANEDATGCSSQQNGVQMKTERGAPAAPNPSYNRQLSVNKPKKSAGKPAGEKSAKFDPLTAKPANVSEQTWADWCQHRKEIRKPLTATSCKQQAEDLANHPNPDAVIKLSIGKGWTGLFPDSALPARAGAQTNASAVLQVPAHHQEMYPDDLI